MSDLNEEISDTVEKTIQPTKPKKPRTPAQQEAFPKMLEKKKEKIE